MKNKFKKDDDVYFPTYDELKSLGWKDNSGIDHGIFHEDCNPHSFIIHERMYNDYGGKVVTVNSPFRDYTEGLYYIKNDSCRWSWPLDLIDKQWQESHAVSSIFHTHEEGMTPLDGWFICKICGDNLREIK